MPHLERNEVMSLNNKQKKIIKKQATETKAIFQLGKQSLTDAFLLQLDQAIEKRELVKVSVLQNAPDETEEILKSIQSHLQIDWSYQIGHTVVLYRRSSEPKHRQLSLEVDALANR